MDELYVLVFWECLCEVFVLVCGLNCDYWGVVCYGLECFDDVLN